MWVNTEEFSREAKFFKKNGYYCAAPRGTKDYKDYWDEQLNRCINGYSVGGQRITGHHYGYLNFAQIKLIDDVDGKHIDKNIKGVSGKKIVSFPSFWDGDAEYFKILEQAQSQGQHLCVGKARRKGFSFKNGWVSANTYNTVKNSMTILGAHEKKFLYGGAGITKMTKDYLEFLNEHTAWTKRRQISSKIEELRASYIKYINGVPIESGYKSTILSLTFKDNPDAARGKDAQLIFFDEAGKWPGLLSSIKATLETLKDGIYTTGIMVVFGTGGEDNDDWADFNELFYNPEPYGFMAVDNIWDEDLPGTKCGFFVPSYMNKTGFMDKDGNSLVLDAKKWEAEKRDHIGKTAKSRSALDSYITENPWCPKEAFQITRGRIFPVAELQRQLSYLETSKEASYLGTKGYLYYEQDGKVKFQVDESRSQADFPTKKNEEEGCVVIYEPPPQDEIPYGLYIAGCLTPGELVPTIDGLKKVEDITLEDKLINKDGEEVGINTLLRYDKVNEPVFKVNMSNVLRPTNYTQEHPLYLSESPDSEFKFIKAKDAKKGMWTKYPNIYNKDKGINITIWDKYKKKGSPKVNNPLLEEDFWWFVGHWLGDGFCYHYGRNYTIYNSFGNDELEYVDKYKDIVTKLFNRKPHLKKQNGHQTHKFECTQLFNFLEDNFGKYADGKYIPEWVKYMPKEFKKQLILGYLDSDGSVYNDRNYIFTSFKSINKTLLNDIQDILFSLGIISASNLSTKENTYNINGKTGISKQSYTLRLNNTETVKLAAMFITDFSSRKLRKAKKAVLSNIPIANKSCRISDNNKYIYIKIKNIEESRYTGIIYNFDCITHTFICQYCTTHNCDPYDHDRSETTSLGSMYIFKQINHMGETYDWPVAEYTGRPDRAQQFYENCMKLLEYYNASCLYENQVKGFHQYLQTKNKDYLLKDQPLIIKDIVKDSKVQREKGIHMSVVIKDYCERITRDWLLEEYAPGKLNLTKIYSKPLLKELIAYDDEGNFDRAIAFMLCILHRLENHKIKVSKNKEFNYIDDFFTRELFVQ